MIDEEIKVEKQEAKAYKPLPSNIYQAEILDISLGQRPTYDTRNLPDDLKEYQKVFKFQFTILNNKEYRGRNVWNNFVPFSLYISHKKGKNELYQLLEAVFGRALTQQEEASIDTKFINGLIGKQLRLFILTVTKGDRSYDRVDKYLPVETQLEPLSQEEKDKARIKPKLPEQKPVNHEIDVVDDHQPPAGTKEINVDGIPF